MADTIELKVPDVGGEEVEVIELLVTVGDTVEKEDGIVTVESDKASMDIPASAGGKIVELKVKEGDTISEGDVLALVEAADAGSSDDADEATEESTDDTANSDEKSEDKAEPEDEAKESSDSDRKASAGEAKVIDVEVPDIGDEEDVEIIEILVSKGYR